MTHDPATADDATTLLYAPGEIPNQDPDAPTLAKVAEATALSRIWRNVVVIGQDIDLLKNAILPPIVGAPTSTLSPADVTAIADALAPLVTTALLGTLKQAVAAELAALQQQ